jgi:hypothetical protein
MCDKAAMIGDMKKELLIINKLDAPISQIYFRNETLHVSDSSSVHYQESSTVHTAMVYVIQVCGQLASRIRMEYPDPAYSTATPTFLR